MVHDYSANAKRVAELEALVLRQREVLVQHGLAPQRVIVSPCRGAESAKYGRGVRCRYCGATWARGPGAKAAHTTECVLGGAGA